MQVSPETSVQHSLLHVVISLDMYNSSVELESLWKPRIFEISCSWMCTCTSFSLRVPHFHFGWQEFYLQNILCTASVLKCFTCLNKSNYCKSGYFRACNFSRFSDFWHFRLFLNSRFLAILHRPTYKINTFACVFNFALARKCAKINVTRKFPLLQYMTDASWFQVFHCVHCSISDSNSPANVIQSGSIESHTHTGRMGMLNYVIHDYSFFYEYS